MHNITMGREHGKIPSSTVWPLPQFCTCLSHTRVPIVEKEIRVLTVGCGNNKNIPKRPHLVSYYMYEVLRSLCYEI